MGPFPLDAATLLTSVTSIVPEIIVVATALFILFLDVVTPEENKRVLCGASLVGIGIALFSVYLLGQEKIEGVSGAICHAGGGRLGAAGLLSACALTLLMATGSSQRAGTHK